MRNVLRAIGVAIIGIAVSGCWVTSLNPYFEQKIAKFEKGLVGTWQNKKGDTTVVIEKDVEGAYKILFSDGGGTSKFKGYLARIGGSLFMDIAIAEDVKGNGLFRSCIVPTHFLVRLEYTSRRIRYSHIGFDWMKGILASDERAISGALMHADGPILLTSTTEEIQDFLATSAGNTEAFAGGEELERLR